MGLPLAPSTSDPETLARILARHNEHIHGVKLRPEATKSNDVLEGTNAAKNSGFNQNTYPNSLGIHEGFLSGNHTNQYPEPIAVGVVYQSFIRCLTTGFVI